MRFLPLFVFCFGLAQGQELTVDEFKAEYLPATARLVEAYNNCRLSGTDSVSGTLKMVIHFDYAANGRNVKFERVIERHKPDGLEVVNRTVVNTQDVQFSLHSQDDKYVLDDLSRSPAGYQLGNEAIASWADYARASYSVLGESVEKRLRDPTFKATSIRRDDDRVRLEFTQGGESPKEGWIRFMPDHMWAIDRWEVTTTFHHPPNYKRRAEATVDYSTFDPVPTLAGYHVSTHHPDRVDTNEYVVESIEFGEVPVSEFKLSHYGIDDRVGLGTSVTPLWMWVALLGVLCMVGAIAISLWQRRNAKRLHAS